MQRVGEIFSKQAWAMWFSPKHVTEKIDVDNLAFEPEPEFRELTAADLREFARRNAKFPEVPREDQCE
jgi:hypothetical protein